MSSFYKHFLFGISSFQIISCYHFVWFWFKAFFKNKLLLNLQRLFIFFFTLNRCSGIFTKLEKIEISGIFVVIFTVTITFTLCFLFRVGIVCSYSVEHKNRVICKFHNEIYINYLIKGIFWFTAVLAISIDEHSFRVLFFIFYEKNTLSKFWEGVLCADHLCWNGRYNFIN